VDGDPGHILEIVKTSKSLEEAAEKLGSTPEYLQSVMDRYEPAEDDVDIEAFPLAAGEAMPVRPLPAWLSKPFPKNAKSRSRWPSGGKSPSWFKKMARCARQHAQRYRYKKPDPSGLDAIIGNAIHGAFQDAAIYRMIKRAGVPMRASKGELLYHLERQPEVIHDRGTEVLRRAAEVIEAMEVDLDLNNVWGAEFVWSFHASAGLLIAGIADLILVFPDPHNPGGPPELVVVVDYKTGPGQVPSQAELRDDPQACLQLIWAKRFFQGAKRVQFMLWNVGQNERVPIDWDHQLERTTLAFVRACFHQWSQKYEKATVKASCKYCPYRSDCKAYNSTLQKEVYRAKERLEDKSIEELVEINYESRKIAEIAEQRKADSADLIMEKLGPFKRKYATGRFTAYRKTRKLTSYSSTSDLLFKLCESSGVDLGRILDTCTSLGSKKLKTFLGTLPEDKQKLAKELVKSMEQQRTSNPWVEVRESSNAGF
jgi:hypothetical protein